MKVHLVHTHPEVTSFVSAMRNVIRAECLARGDDVTESDLYALGFNPIMSGTDFPDRKQPDQLVYALEQRAAFEAKSLPADITREVEHVLACDLLVFTFPIYWFSPPAMLKGWIERVFLSGPFYGGRRLYDGGGLRDKRAFVATSLGGREHMFGPDAIHGELERGMLKPFLQGTLGYVGLEVLEPFVAYHVPYVDAARRADMLQDLRAIIRTIDGRPAMPMPKLSNFDSRLAPI